MPHPTTTLTINCPGIAWQQITVTAASTVAETQQHLGSQLSTGLTVDGRFIPLVLSKHLDGRPDLAAAIEAALSQVEVAIAALQLAPHYEKEIVYDPETRDFAMSLDGELVGFARSSRDADEQLDALVYRLLIAAGAAAAAAEPAALGEPMPASEAEALARQLVRELSEYDTMNLPCDARYDAKSAQVRELGFDIGPAGDGSLCLYDSSTQRPLHPPAPLADRIAAAIGCAPQQAAEALAHLAAHPLTEAERAILAETAPTTTAPTDRDPITAAAAALVDCLDDMALDADIRAAAAAGRGESPAYWRMRARRARKAAAVVQAGAGIWWQGGMLCIESHSTPGTIRRVSRDACDCPWGAADGWCYHREIRCAVEAVEAAEASEVWADADARGVFGIAA